jgi:hypothetical protein
MTGSVATTLADKIIPALQEIGEVKVIMTEAALRFANPLTLHKRHAVDVYTDVHEWSFTHYNGGLGVKPGFAGNREDPEPHLNMETESADDWLTTSNELWSKNMPVLHIELRKWADVLVIAPLTANTLAKMAVGISDNLVTSVFRAWDKTKPVIVAPAMNTEMWDVDITEDQLETLRLRFNPDQKRWNRNQAFDVVYPVEKELACGDKGMGALAPISDIAERVKDSMRWLFPLVEDREPYSHRLGIPMGNHPGAFAYHRHKAHHTGVDLYTDEDAPVYAVEGGVVVGIQGFTGAKVGMEWWNDTDAVLVEGRSGVVNYGEIKPRGSLKIGSKVQRGDLIGWVTPVVKAGKERPDVPGHSRSMLHIELYPHGHKEWTAWPLGQEEHAQIDPTDTLLEAIDAPQTWPEFEGEL